MKEHAVSDTKSLRLFIACSLPKEVQQLLLEIQTQLKLHVRESLRWVHPERSHLTVKFLGETPTNRVKPIRVAIASACLNVAPLHLETGDLGTFGSHMEPRVIQLGLRGIKPLVKFHQQLEQNLSALGWPAEKRSFSPHLTIARIPAKVTNLILPRLTTALAQVKPTPTPLTVTEIKLISSILQPEESAYRTIATYRFM